MEITLQELKELEENQYELVDMRDEGELAYGTIPGAVHIPIENFDEIKDNDKKYVLHKRNQDKRNCGRITDQRRGCLQLKRWIHGMAA